MESDENYADALAEIFSNRKKLKEAETQVKSLTFILEQVRSGAAHGIDLVALEQSKGVLQSRMLEIKEYISIKELQIRRGNESSPKEEFLEGSSNIGKEGAFQDEKELSSSESNALTTSTSEWMDESGSSGRSESSFDDLGMIALAEESSFIESLRKENARLRQQLSEAKQKHKEERNNIIENLRILEMETVKGEKNWKNEAHIKQLKIEELMAQSIELKTKNNELMVVLENGETLRKKLRKKESKIIKKKEEEIAELKLSVGDVKVEKGKLKEDLKDVQIKLIEAEGIVKEFTEREVELKGELYEKNQTVEDRTKDLEKCSEEVVRNDFEEQVLTLTNSLEIKLSRVKELNDEKKLLHEKLDEKSQNEDKFCREKDLENQIKINKELELQLSEINSHVKRLEGHDVENKQEVMELKQKLLQKEGTIQELTISLGKTIEENDVLHCELERDLAKNTSSLVKVKLSNSVQNIMNIIRKEVTTIQEDVTRHKASVDSLGYRWSHYKKCVQEIHQDLTTGN